MTYRVKDAYKNLLVEYDTYQEFADYTSASLEANPDIQFFEYDFDLYERFVSGSEAGDYNLENTRVTYNPSQDDIEE